MVLEYGLLAHHIRPSERSQSRSHAPSEESDKTDHFSIWSSVC